ncbi:MauE/DoxX family redox-associated membrane protein [Synechococcus sp. PCC 7336]|uniref:MauE/DoxX family redox-associated membrane protein n=1 Tax=Synechococcus sp. PCC 7336 TaxID=195250 RepID=UPI0003461A0E|nr:MauE/DoxX family redox-associated membrane protein [Synechococcus sp. PCC 7336]
MDTKLANRLPIVLFLLRLSVFAVLLMWAIDKFLNPGHTADVFAGFYSIGNLSSTVSYVLGAIQLAIIVAFLLGILKTWSYGLVLLMHAASTLVAYKQYLDPYNGPNLLFFAAWPMLAACIALFMLRDFDTRWSLGRAAPMPASEAS